MAKQNDDTSRQKGKAKYLTPRVRRIELAAEEVLSTGCKLSGGGSAFGSSPCSLNICFGAGS